MTASAGKHTWRSGGHRRYRFLEHLSGSCPEPVYISEWRHNEMMFRLLLIAFAGVSLLVAQQSVDLDRKLAGKIATAVKQSGAPSVSVAAVQNGRLVYAKAFGIANIAVRRSRTGSSSKSTASKTLNSAASAPIPRASTLANPRTSSHRAQCVVRVLPQSIEPADCQSATG